MQTLPQVIEKRYINILLKDLEIKIQPIYLNLEPLQDRGTIDVLAKGLDYANLNEVAIIKDEFEKIYSEYCGIIQSEVNLEELDLDVSTIDLIIKFM